MALELVQTDVAADQMMPSQYADCRKRRTQTPGEALAYAILARAVMDLRPPEGVRTRAARRAYNDAYRWVLSNDRTYVFSFINTCEFLRLNPFAVRRELLELDRSRNGGLTVHEAA